MNTGYEFLNFEKNQQKSKVSRLGFFLIKYFKKYDKFRIREHTFYLNS
jgi:hypothetical protein